MPEAPGDGPHVDPGAGQRGGCEVAEVVEFDVGEPQLGPDGPESVGDPVGPVGDGTRRILGPHVGVGADGDPAQRGPSSHPIELGAERGDRGWVGGDPPGPVGFGVLLYHPLGGVSVIDLRTVRVEVTRSMSIHRSPHSSPRRQPVVAAT